MILFLDDSELFFESYDGITYLENFTVKATLENLKSLLLRK